MLSRYFQSSTPYLLDYDLDTRESVEGKNYLKEVKGGGLVEGGAYAKWGKQLTEHDTDWEEIVKMVESMGFSLVPSENVTIEEGKNISVRKKRCKRELRNLKFDQRFRVQKGNCQFQMKILRWNVRGCGSYRKRRNIKEVTSKEDPDIVVL